MTGLQDYLGTAMGFIREGTYSCSKVKSLNILVNTEKEEQGEAEILIPVNISDMEHLVESYLNEYLADRIIKDFYFAEDSLKVCFLLRNSSEISIDSYILSLAEKLESLQAKNSCSTCKSQDQVDIYSFRDSVRVFCPNCKSKENKTLLAMKDQPGNYLRGFAGAILGALAGSIVWIILGTYGIVHFLGGIVMGSAALAGYRIFKGRQSKRTILILVFALLVGIFFANLAQFYLQLMREVPDYSIAKFIPTLMEILGYKDFQNTMITNILLGTIYGGAGLIPLIAFLLRDSRGLARERSYRKIV